MNAPVHSLHATYAPSSAHRWTVCTASATAISALGEQEEGDAARKGTAAHEEIERRLKPLARDLKAKPLPADEDHPSAYGVALVVDYVSKLVGTPTIDDRLWIEQRVALTDVIWGRCDVSHWHAESQTLTIADYKDGFVGVDPDAEQIRIYAAASMFTHRLPVKWIRYAIIQPNDFRPVPRVKQDIESVDSLYAWAEVVATIPKGPLTFVAGEQCKYCPLFGRCPASQDVLTRLSVMLANPPDAVRPDQVALFKACEKPVTDWFKALDKAATKAALAGDVPAGMKLVTSTKHRDWTNPEAARTAVLETLGEGALELPTPAQAEKLGMTKEKVAALASVPEGGPALAFESDKRKPWVRKSATEMFAGVLR